MANVVLVLVVVILVSLVILIVNRRRHGLVAERGTSIGADLGALADQPRVRVRTVTAAGPDRVRLVLTPERRPFDGIDLTTSSDIDLVVFLREEEFGFELLLQWKRFDSSLAIVIAPDSQIVRLRSIDDLQPLTLRRVDDR